MVRILVYDLETGLFHLMIVPPYMVEYALSVALKHHVEAHILHDDHPMLESVCVLS